MWLPQCRYMLQSLFGICIAESKGANTGKSKKKNRRKKTFVNASTDDEKRGHRVSASQILY